MENRGALSECGVLRCLLRRAFCGEAGKRRTPFFVSPREVRGLFHAWDLADSHRREKAFEIGLRIGRAFMASAFPDSFP